MEIKDSIVLLKAKNKFCNNRFDEKKYLTNLRFDLSSKLIKLRDKSSETRHKERLQILATKL